MRIEKASCWASGCIFLATFQCDGCDDVFCDEHASEGETLNKHYCEDCRE